MKPLIETLQNWDISLTETILQKMEVEKERRKTDELRKKNAETNKYVFYNKKMLQMSMNKSCCVKSGEHYVE